MGGTTSSYNSIDDVITKLNAELQNLPAMGSFTPNDFLSDPQKIILSQESFGLSTEHVDTVINLYNVLNGLKSYDTQQNELKKQLGELIKQIPNPIVDENADEQSREFWIKIYNLLVYDILANSKFSAMGKSGKTPTFDHRILELPENITLNQINLYLNHLLDRKLKSVKNYYQLYLDDEKELCKELMNLYPSDHIYGGLTYNLEVINCFSKKVQNLILMHVILNNQSSWVGEFKYSKDNSHLKLPESIEESYQFSSIDKLDDVLDCTLFTVGMDFENLSFLRQPMYTEFIEEHSEYFNNIFTKRLEHEKAKQKEKQEKKLKTQL